ncbi:phosphatase 2C-like domain-containing protein [Paraphysoderma sedebokerense]|nr:phosphatase 2C-like domain-containing protein [Paraphysoderma sedebokerense]
MGTVFENSPPPTSSLDFDSDDDIQVSKKTMPTESSKLRNMMSLEDEAEDDQQIQSSESKAADNTNSDPIDGFHFKIGFHEDRNRLNRRTMEDAHSYFYDFADVKGQGFFAVFDGHAGKMAADWCGKNLHHELLKAMDELPESSIPEIMNETFVRTDEELSKANISSGCTAVTSFIRRENGKHVLYTANVGDARAVLCRNGTAIRLTYDHKGCDPIEGKRIVEAGGFIMNNRVNGVLAVTRSLGDAPMKELIVGNPFTTEIELTSEDEFLILACDGVWDVVSDQEAVNLIRSNPDPQAAAEKLVEYSLENFSTDNLSCIIVRFHFPAGYKSETGNGNVNQKEPEKDNGKDSKDKKAVESQPATEKEGDDTPTPRSLSMNFTETDE